MTDHSELIEKLERNARAYEAEAKAMKPEDARHLGPIESACVGGLLREAAEALRQG